MPGGCNLYETEGDHKQIWRSLSKGLQADVSKEVKRDKKAMIEAATSGKILQIMQDSNKPGHKALREYLYEKIAGGEPISESYKRELPDAVAKIIKHTPDIMGLFKPTIKERGKGATGLIKSLHHKTRGDAFAYELLGTAALIDEEFHAATNNADTLRIRDTDRIDYHLKLQASYKGVPTKYLDQPNRGTVEADLFINRPVGLNNLKVIGVDFKHSRESEYHSYDINQLKGIKVALQTGEIDEFCFVSNVKFSQTFKDKIEAINSELYDSERDLDSKPEFSSEKLTQEERDNSYAPVIKLFENVRYRGT